MKNEHFKVITLGPLFSGKTCFIKRYCEEFFEEDYHPTIGIDYGLKTFDLQEGTLSLSFFDLSGDSYFSLVRQEYYKDVDIVMLFVDVSCNKSLEQTE